jgi:carbon starvation protein CstA
MEHGNLVGKTALIDVMGMFMEYMMMNTIVLPVWPILRKAGYLSNLVEKIKLNTFLQHIRLA